MTQMKIFLSARKTLFNKFWKSKRNEIPAFWAKRTSAGISSRESQMYHKTFQKQPFIQIFVDG